MNAAAPALPRTVDCGGETVELRLMTAADQDAVLAFAPSPGPGTWASCAS